MIGTWRGTIGGLRDVISRLRSGRFISLALGVAFLKFRHVQIMARNFEVALAHIKARRSLGEMQVFGRAIAISARPYPKAKFAYGFAIRHFATHEMQHERILTGARRTARGSRAVERLAYTVIRSTDGAGNSQFLRRPVGNSTFGRTKMPAPRSYCLSCYSPLVKRHPGECPERQRGRTVNPLAYAFVGSSPTSPTTVSG
jgi:hypothetical protein